MNSSSITYIIDIIILAFGIYLAYSSYKMKTTNVPPSLLVSPEEMRKAKDPKAFCTSVNIQFIILSILSILYGIFGFVYNIFSSRANDAAELLKQAEETKDAVAIAEATQLVELTKIPFGVTVFTVAILGIYIVYVVYFVIILKKNRGKYI